MAKQDIKQYIEGRLTKLLAEIESVQQDPVELSILLGMIGEVQSMAANFGIKTRHIYTKFPLTKDLFDKLIKKINKNDIQS